MQGTNLDFGLKLGKFVQIKYVLNIIQLCFYVVHFVEFKKKTFNENKTQ